MIKLLVNSPSGEQQIIEITISGSYFDNARVIWDERINGTLPAITLGKMQRVGNTLNTLADYLPAHAAWMAARQAETDEAARVESIEQSARIDATVALLKGMNNQQLDDWFVANIDTLVKARGLLKLIFKLIIRKV